MLYRRGMKDEEEKVNEWQKFVAKQKEKRLLIFLFSVTRGGIFFRKRPLGIFLTVSCWGTGWLAFKKILSACPKNEINNNCTHNPWLNSVTCGGKINPDHHSSDIGPWFRGRRGSSFLLFPSISQLTNLEKVFCCGFNFYRLSFEI